LLEQWDANYRLGHPPFWDAGMPSGELRRVVEDGTIRACRAVELGCGSGTDAVYLASQGFDVTAIDIAPSALSQAAQKAQKADVHVKWLLADVLRPPQLDPFDFIYDRGCYHEVRAQNLAAYLETLRRLSRPGTRFILLAGNANEVLDYGPPRVTEEELRFFSAVRI
jgi:methyl halide transferase